MKNFNKHMPLRSLNTCGNPVPVEAGIYDIIKVIRMMDTEEAPRALVQFRKDVSYTPIETVGFTISLESLYIDGAVGDKHLLSESLEGKSLHVKRVYEMPVIYEKNIKYVTVADWQVIDIFQEYDLCKQLGGDTLVVAPEVWDYYDQVEIMEEIREAESYLIDVAKEEQEITDSLNKELDSDPEQQLADFSMAELISNGQAEYDNEDSDWPVDDNNDPDDLILQ